MLGGADNPNGELPSYITGANTLDGIARMSANSDYRNLYQAMVQARRFDTGSCSESCEIWGDQLELEFEEVGV